MGEQFGMVHLCVLLAHLKPRAFKLYVTLSTFADGNTGECNPSRAMIQKRCGLRRDEIGKGLAELEEAGLLLRDHQMTARGADAANAYILLPFQRASSGWEGTENPAQTPRNRVRKSRRPKNRPKEQTKVVFPVELDSKEFQESWAEWEAYRREKKKALTPSTRGKQLKMLARMGTDAAIISIDQSITAGWIGLFEPKTNGQTTGAGLGQRHPADKGKW